MVGTGFASRLVLLSCLLAFAALKLYGAIYAAGDENIYLYLATAMADGASPYVDFFHAHPPLHLLPLAWLYQGFGGFEVAPARVLAGASTALAGLMIARLARIPWSWPAVVGSAIFLSSYDVLRVSTHFTGSNLATFWVTLGLERLCRGRDVQAAVAFCLGGFTLPIAAPAAVGATLALFFVDRRRAARLASIGTGVVVLLLGGAYLRYGPAFFEQVYFFHLGKTAQGADNAGVLLSIVQMNGLLVAGAVVGVIAWLLDALPRSEPEGEMRELEAQLPLWLSLGATLGSLSFLISSPRIFVYYFQTLFACMAPLAGAGVVALVQTVRIALASGEAPARGGSRFAAAVLSIVFVAGMLPGVTIVPAAGAGAVEHTWVGSGVAPLDSLLRPVFWTPLEEPGDLYPTLTHYLWHEADHFDSARALAAEVRKHCGPEETVFGASTAAPLVALLAERRLALGEADTNHLRFRARQPPAEAFIARLEEAPPCAVVEVEGRGVFNLRPFAEWLERHHHPILQTGDPLGSRRYRLHLRREAHRDAGDPPA